MSWLDFAEGTQGGIGQADIERARAKGYSEQAIQAELARASQAGYKVGSLAQASMSGPQGMTPFEYDYQKAIDLANIQAGISPETAKIQKESALGVAGIQKESALGVANIDKQIKEMQLESAENLQKLSNSSKLTLANAATNQGILAGLVSAFNF